MGVNQDSVEVAFNLSIRNARDLDYSAQGTMAKDSSTRMNFFGRLHDFCLRGVADTQEERHSRYAAMADEAFDEEENKI